MNLVVVESPTKAKTLGKFLGRDYIIKASMGHVKDLPKSTLGVNVENNFEPDFRVVPKKKEVIDEIVKSAKLVKNGFVFLATDPDREGEAIASHIGEIILEKLKDKKGLIKRITFHEITKEAVLDSLKNPKDVNKELVAAQTARRVLDRLVGYKLSPLLWKKIRRGLSAGRVQTVAVRLIVEREREIESFVPKEYWEIFAVLSKEQDRKNIFRAKLVRANGKKIEIASKREADSLLDSIKRAIFRVGSIDTKEIKKHALPPFTTSTLTQKAANIFYWSSKRTMAAAQRLYEKGLITYHRTDSVNIAHTALDRVRDLINRDFGGDYLPSEPKVFRNKAKIAQEAHEAIRPTDVFLKPYSKEVELEPDLNKLYDLVWKRFVACQMSDALYEETKIRIEALEGNNNYDFLLIGSKLKFDGWQVVYPKKQEEADFYSPDLSEGEIVSLIKLDPVQNFTQPPSRYNEASLIKTLEKLGIGRPSTYAPIISTIQLRNYVEKKEGRFVPTKIGVAVNDFLIPSFKETFDYGFTAKMEDRLDEIAKGKIDWHKVVSDFWNPFYSLLSFVEANSERVKIETEKIGRKCPECEKNGKQGELVVRIGRFGKFISCSNFPECKYREKYVEKVGIPCPECTKKGLPAGKSDLPAGRQGEVIVKKTAKGKKFYGCSRYPDCRWASWKLPKKEE